MNNTPRKLSGECQTSPPRYNINIVESGVKHHKPTTNQPPQSLYASKAKRCS